MSILQNITTSTHHKAIKSLKYKHGFCMKLILTSHKITVVYDNLVTYKKRLCKR